MASGSYRISGADGVQPRWIAQGNRQLAESAFFDSAPQYVSAAGAIATAGAFGTPTVTLMLQLVTGAGGIATAQASGTPTVAGPITLTSGIASGEAFGTPTVSFGTQVVSPSSIASGEAFGSPTVVLEDAFITGAGAIATGAAFGTPTIGVTIHPTGVATGEAFGSPVLSPRWLYPGSIFTAEIVGQPTVTTGSTTISPTGVASSGAVGSPSVTHTVPAGQPQPRQPNRLYDPADATSYDWIVNHSAEAAEGWRRSVSHGGQPRVDKLTDPAVGLPGGYDQVLESGGLIRQQAPGGHLALSWQGTCFTQAEVDALADFYARSRTSQLILTDFTGREFEVIVTMLDMVKVPAHNPRVPGLLWVWRYTIGFRAIVARAGAEAELGVLV